MVSSHEMDRDSGIDDPGEGSEYSRMPTGHYASPLEPKVEQVSVQEDEPRSLSRVLEPSMESLFHFRRCGAEMGIGGHVDRTGVHGGGS